MCYVKLSRKRLDFEKLSRDQGHQPQTLYSSLAECQINQIYLNFHLQKSLEIFEKNSAEKI